MKKIPIIALLVVVVIAGAVYTASLGKRNKATETAEPVMQENQQQTQLVGNDRDEHGCIGSAGYTWCEAKQKCLRSWEEPCVSGEEDKDAIISQVKTQLVEEHGQTAEGMTVTVSKVEGDYASGGARESEGGGGGMWFAAKVGGEWKLVWDGNGVIFCKNLEPYPDFPTDMIPDCYDQATDTMQTR